LEELTVQHFAGLDVPLNEANVCIVDDNGAIVRELKIEIALIPTYES
jgi:hypothetical protein